MSKYRHSLPQLDGGIFLTDSGLETTLIFHDGLDLPCFAAHILLREVEGRKRLHDYYARHIRLANERADGFVLEAPTWRANPDWGTKLGYSDVALDAANKEAIALLEEVRSAFETDAFPIVISGCIGPRGDGYDPGNVMIEEEAEAYHAVQIASLAAAGADFISAFTMTNLPEAIGIVRAARKADMPVVISFTAETDGRLPTGQTLKEAVEAVDAATGSAPAYYMINCAHPEHFGQALEAGEGWVRRVRGLRANASRRSHAELDSAADLDAGDPVELGGQYRDLIRRHGGLTVLGGCCGTDHRHVAEIAGACCGDRKAA